MLGCNLPEKGRPQPPGARDIADKLDCLAGFHAAVLVPLQHNGKRIDVETDDDSIGGHFPHLLHGEKPVRPG